MSEKRLRACRAWGQPVHISQNQCLDPGKESTFDPFDLIKIEMRVDISKERS
jgi:hypothetical protein